MACKDVKFTKQELDNLGRISDVLADEKARKILEKYLKNPNKRVYQVWKLANDSKEIDMDLIELISDFNLNPLLSEGERKLEYVLQECCRLLEKVHPIFIEYLIKHHT